MKRPRPYRRPRLLPACSSSLLIRTTLLAAACLVAAAWSETPPSVTRPFTQQTRALVHEAMETSKLSATNITAAFAACDQWRRVMHPSVRDAVPGPIRGMCLALQASCLVRTGQDEQAVDVYEHAIQLGDVLSEETLREVILGKAFSYQRLQKYKQAREQFLQSSSLVAARGAAVCALRLGQVNSALSVLEGVENNSNVETNAMLATVRYLQQGASTDAKAMMAALKEASATFPLYRWIHRILATDSATFDDDNMPLVSLLDMAVLNTCAFDDPLLLHLDDKVLLHKLLVDRVDAALFWPPGLILPSDCSALSKMTNTSTTGSPASEYWFCKKRAGYGSHGNAIVTAQQAFDLSRTLSDDMLLQRMVQPPLLLQGRKFSLRIYAVYFGASSASSRPQVFLSTQGLVKLASKTLKDDTDASNSHLTIDLDMHMTNSGRDTNALQEDLTFLRAEFDKAGWSFSDLWGNIANAVRGVLVAYSEKTDQLVQDDVNLRSCRCRIAELGIPKILGFDFVVDASKRVWVIEVNRFPGLEARDEQDKAVKQRVIRDAWRMAARRAGLENDAWMVSSLDDTSVNGGSEGSDSLQRIEL